jgi:hypothetical protein
MLETGREADVPRKDAQLGRRGGYQAMRTIRPGVDGSQSVCMSPIVADPTSLRPSQAGPKQTLDTSPYTGLGRLVLLSGLADALRINLRTGRYRQGNDGGGKDNQSI